MNYNKLIMNRKPFTLPWLMFEDWTFTSHGIITHDKHRPELLTPGQLSLLYYKSGFYDRGGKVTEPERYKW